MKSLHEQTHYEVLEVARNASPEQIERAYRLATETYEDDSLATYSVFEAGEASAIRDRIHQAFAVLSSADTRAHYDREQFGESQVSVPEGGSQGEPATSERLEDLDTATAEESGDFSGDVLRRARLRRGIDLDQVSDVTKVRAAYLRCIEEEHFDGLPADVYVRGFVSAYAQTIGLDAALVVESYMSRVENARRGSGRGRLLSRR